MQIIGYIITACCASIFTRYWLDWFVFGTYIFACTVDVFLGMICGWQFSTFQSRTLIFGIIKRLVAILVILVTIFTVESLSRIVGFNLPLESLISWFIGIMIFGELVSIVWNATSIANNRRIEEHDIVSKIFHALYKKLNRILDWLINEQDHNT